MDHSLHKYAYQALDARKLKNNTFIEYFYEAHLGYFVGSYHHRRSVPPDVSYRQRKLVDR